MANKIYIADELLEQRINIFWIYATTMRSLKMSNRNTICHYLLNDNKSAFDLSLLNKYFPISFIIYIGFIMSYELSAFSSWFAYDLHSDRYKTSFETTTLSFNTRNFNGLIVITVSHFYARIVHLYHWRHCLCFLDS